MPYFSAFSTGILLAIMVYANGLLSSSSNVLFSSLVYHLIGLGFFGLILILNIKTYKTTVILRRITSYELILPGLLGALTIVLTNIVIPHLGVVLMVGISLLGQVTASLVIDGLGLLGKKKIHLGLQHWSGLFVMAIGVWMILAY